MKTRRLRTILLIPSLVIFSLGLLICGPALGAIHGRFLPDPLGLNDIANITYGGNLAEFTQPVLCDGQNIGEIRFTYDTWSGDFTGAGDGTTGGGALAGGFYRTAGASAPGWQLGWVQTVISTFSGSNVWGAPNGTTFPDTATKADPDYPFESLPAGLNPAPPAPTIGFQDFPNRFPSDGNQFWLAELGLVCKNLTTHTVEILDTFLWGFDVVNNDGITANAPHLWGAPTTTYVDTLTNSFDGANGSTKWTFTTGGENCCVPEPASVFVWVVLVGGSIAVARSRQRRRAA